jgi:hypothetical protein
VTLPAGLAAGLPKDSTRSWEAIAPVLPEGAYLVCRLGYFGDVGDDEAPPVSRDEIVAYWRKRQPELIRNIGRSLQGLRRAPARSLG